MKNLHLTEIRNIAFLLPLVCPKNTQNIWREESIFWLAKKNNFSDICQVIEIYFHLPKITYSTCRR